MSNTGEEENKHWTPEKKAALVLEIMRGKTSLAEASLRFGICASEIDKWVGDAKRGMENALHTPPLGMKEQYERQIKALQDAYGQAMVELHVRR